jgi:hypothetical protein
VGVRPSLGGTIYNCAGGATPWGSWLSCEETVIDLTKRGGRRHGYVFEVRADAAETTAKPIVGMGRMLHEAIAVDQATGIAYLTEDEAWNSGFYRYVADSARVGPGSYEAGGRLQAARVARRAHADLRTPAVGDVHAIEWVDIENPDADPGRTPPEIAGSPPVRASGPFLQSWAHGGLVMSRGEGICHHGGKLYLVDTEAGRDAGGLPGHGDGAVWEYDPREQTLTAIFVAGSQQVGDNIDNITASPPAAVRERRSRHRRVRRGDAAHRHHRRRGLVRLREEQHRPHARGPGCLGQADLRGLLPCLGMGGRLLRSGRRGPLRQHPDPGHHVRDLGALGARESLKAL